MGDVPNEILTAQQEDGNESRQKLCFEKAQMYIEQNFEIEAEHQDIIMVDGNDEEKMVTFEIALEREDQLLPKTSNLVLHNIILQKKI